MRSELENLFLISGKIFSVIKKNNFFVLEIQQKNNQTFYFWIEEVDFLFLVNENYKSNLKSSEFSEIKKKITNQSIAMQGKIISHHENKNVFLQPVFLKIS
ncbi:hypothetical protein MCAV_02180 [[Mycoplasma] cavipharyngis]|uniref:hypothetical protein n=1 Tax=[Mycoplasma] cavipharyngis TaxID=92757 RepID=UPI0037048BCB